MPRRGGGWRRTVLVGLLLGRTAAVEAQDDQPVVLQEPATVRSAGLNRAAVALVGDAGSVFANPAGLATIRNVAIESSIRTAPADAYFWTGALAWRLRQFHFGGGVRVFDFGPEPGTYLPGVAPGTRAREVLAAGSGIYRFGILAFGGTGKYIRRTVGDERREGFGADAGVAIALFDLFALAFAVQNIRGGPNDSMQLDLPRLSRFGFTMNYVDPQQSFRLLSTLEVQWPEGQAARLVVGGEAGAVVARVGLIGRVAWASRPATPGQSQGTFGATLALSRLNLDLAYQASDLVGESAYRFGLRLTL